MKMCEGRFVVDSLNDIVGWEIVSLSVNEENGYPYRAWLINNHTMPVQTRMVYFTEESLTVR